MFPSTADMAVVVRREEEEEVVDMPEPSQLELASVDIFGTSERQKDHRTDVGAADGFEGNRVLKLGEAGRWFCCRVRATEQNDVDARWSAYL